MMDAFAGDAFFFSVPRKDDGAENSLEKKRKFLAKTTENLARAAPRVPKIAG